MRLLGLFFGRVWERASELAKVPLPLRRTPVQQIRAKPSFNFSYPPPLKGLSPNTITRGAKVSTYEFRGGDTIQSKTRTK